MVRIELIFYEEMVRFSHEQLSFPCKVVRILNTSHLVIPEYHWLKQEVGRRELLRVIWYGVD